MFRLFQNKIVRPGINRLGIFTSFIQPSSSFQRFFSNQDASSRLHLSRVIKTNMSYMSEALHQLKIPATHHPKVTQLLVAHHEYFDPSSTGKNTQPTLLADIIATRLEKIFNTLYAEPGDIKEVVLSHQDRIECLTLQMKDFQAIQQARAEETPTKTIDCSSFIKDYNLLIQSTKNRIEELQSPEKAIYRKLSASNLALLDITKKIDTFDKYKCFLLEIQKELQTANIIHQKNCSNAPFRIRN